MQSIKTKAIVLRRTNYGEADRILQIITPEKGKMGVIAKGIRREKSKLASAVELFSKTELVIVKGRGDLGTLTSARLDTFYKHIMEDYERLQFGYEVLKRVSAIGEHVSEEAALYDFTETALKSLDNLSIDLRLIRAWFYLQASELVGHGLNLSRDANNQPLQADLRYRFDIAEMSFIEMPNGNFTAEHLKLLKIMKLKSPEIVARVSGIANYLDDCLSLAHAVGE